MNTKRIIIGLILIPIAIWIYLTMENGLVKYFGGITLMIIGLIVLFSGFKKKNYADSAPPAPMEPDEHTPGFKQKQVDNDEHKSDV